MIKVIYEEKYSSANPCLNKRTILDRECFTKSDSVFYNYSSFLKKINRDTYRAIKFLLYRNIYLYKLFKCKFKTAPKLKVPILIFLTMLLISGCNNNHRDYSLSGTLEKKQLIKNLIAKEDFLAIFANANIIGIEKYGEGNFSVTEVVDYYLSSHGRDRETVIKLLEKNNFSVKENISYDSRHYPRNNPSLLYEEMIVGTKRISSFTPFVWRNYVVSFYLVSGDVVGLNAYSVGDAL